ncbi:hypothetical protein [Gimesia chilikensis]|uniref:Uncharacterized protein n=1 Tax=Gimesia chilikensis TaxID=2605989 RepID=A0A517PSX2_9PLAN|nr:hypothetical protein [Gimesia chilikensis]QDT22471.1 hypothetical protein HG66A1_42790 [Gimesia chilikensis]
MPETTITLSRIYSLMNDEAYSVFRLAMLRAEHGLVRISHLAEALNEFAELVNDRCLIPTELISSDSSSRESPVQSQPMTNHPRVRAALVRAFEIASKDNQESQTITRQQLAAAITLESVDNPEQKRQLLYRFGYAHLVPTPVVSNEVASQTELPVQDPPVVAGRSASTSFKDARADENTELAALVRQGLQAYLDYSEDQSDENHRRLATLVRQIDN